MRLKVLLCMPVEGQGNSEPPWSEGGTLLPELKGMFLSSPGCLSWASFLCWWCPSGLSLVSSWNPCLAQPCCMTSPYLTALCCPLFSSGPSLASFLGGRRCTWLTHTSELLGWVQWKVRWTSELVQKWIKVALLKAKGLSGISLSECQQVIKLIQATACSFSSGFLSG